MAARGLLVLLGTCAALAGCGAGSAAPVRTTAAGGPPRAAPPRLAGAACHLPGFRCARLTVPLHRRGPRAGDGVRLTLDVALQDGGRTPRGDVVLLSGGPGQPARPFGPRMLRRLDDALDGYRLVLLDQRGTGAGALRCPALQRAVGASDLAVAPRAAVLACAHALGDARDAYATADSVADLDAMRAALGDARWVLAGISYGSFVAERYALAHPDRTRGLVLDSVVPQAGAELLERVPLRATARVLRGVCRDAATPCPADPADDLAALLRRRPALGPALFDALTALSIGVPRLGRVPALLHRARRGDTGPLQALVAAVHRTERVPADLLSQGLHAATLCADSPAPWGGPQAGPAVRAAALARARRTVGATDTAPFPPATAFGQGLVLTCRWWPPVAAPPAPAPTAVVRAPALLLNGDRDLSTPLEWARAQARAMPGARLLVATGAGHSVLSRDPRNRGRDALRDFLRGL
jgi:pimeloyl-ACP methyl ester carboxylesterase